MHALAERAEHGISFPHVVGYRYELGDDRIDAKFNDDSSMTLSPEQVPTRVEVATVIGQYEIHTLDDLKKLRDRQVVFLLAKQVLEKFFRDEGSDGTAPQPKSWLFPQVLSITERWYHECVDCKDDAFPQLLYLAEFAHDAADKIHRAIANAAEEERCLKPILAPYEWLMTTNHVDFDTSRPVYATRDKCHVSHIVCDTGSWEQKVAQAIEEMDEVVSYIKNDRQPGFVIPYTVGGDQRSYYPDFVARLNDGRGADDPLNVIIEVTGEKRRDKEAKVATARDLWVPAVNNHGGFGRWAFVEVTDPWRAKTQLRATFPAAVAARSA